MTRHEADRVHEASGIAFTFAGHLVWGNPKLAEGLHGDIEAWRCGLCKVLVVGDEATQGEHAEQHLRVDVIAGEHVELRTALEMLREKLDRVDAQVRTQMGELADVVEKVDCIAHGAFKPIETSGTVERERRNPPATAHEMGADVERLHRVARWRDAAAVREVTSVGDAVVVRESPAHSAARETAEQLRADELPE